VLQIVANDARNAVRGRGRRRLREARYEALRVRTGGDPAVDPVGDRVMADDEARRLLALLGRLDERDRAVLACRFVAGLSEHETAAVLGVPIGTVKSRTARALQRARTLGAGDE
jgi:RNA polymerase sigma-70 factor (ECF subfamily)